MDEQLRTRIEKVNEYYTIPQLIPQLKLGTNDCLKCGRKSKLSVSEHSVKCWHPSCSWNEPVPMLKLFQELNNKTYKGGFFEVLNELEKNAGIAKITNTVYRTHSGLLNKVKLAYQFYLNLKPYREVKEYLYSRGISEDSISKLGIGYAPHNKCLRNLKTFSDRDLIELDLIDGDREFFSHRIIFPVYHNGYLCHLQGRYYGKIPTSNGSAVCGKYKCTKTGENAVSISNCLALENYLSSYVGERLYVCEGFPDSISLWQQNLNAVGIMGLEGISKHIHKFKPWKEIIFCFDNDRYDLDHPTCAGKYKSWSRVLPQLIDLQFELPQTCLKIFIPPTENNVKDINDLALTVNNLPDLINTESIELVDFLTKIWSKNYERHYLLVQLLIIKNKLEKLEPFVEQFSPLEYGKILMSSLRS